MSEQTTFTEELFALFAAIRSLLGGHVALLRAEIGAIVRDAVALVIGAIAIVSLLVVALVGLLIALALIVGELLFGSSLWGASHLTIALIAVAVAILSSLLRIDRGRRGRSLLLAIVVVAVTGAALVGAFSWSVAPALGLAITLGLLALLADLLIGLRAFDSQRFADRFRPVVSEAEFRATVDALDDLRDEAVAGVGAEFGAAVGSADEAIGAIRSATSTLAEAFRRISERLREHRDGEQRGDNQPGGEG